MVSSLANRSSLDSPHFARSLSLLQTSYPFRTVLSSTVETIAVEPCPTILGIYSMAGETGLRSWLGRLPQGETFAARSERYLST